MDTMDTWRIVKMETIHYHGDIVLRNTCNHGNHTITLADDHLLSLNRGNY